jgi:hypothetical protein
LFSIFSDRSFLVSDTTPHAAIFVPFWGKNPELPGDPTNGRFDRYAQVGGSLLRLSALSECDVGVFPQSWESAGDRAFELGERFAAICGEAGKTPVIFHSDDSTERLPVEGVVFRTSLLRSQRGPNEFAQPAWSEDFVDRYLGGELRPRPNRTRPVVGFCGNTMAEPPSRTLGGRLRRVLGGAETDATNGLAGSHPRTVALRGVRDDERLKSNFVLRDGFWGAGVGRLLSPVEARKEYVQNMLASDYVLCARGIGNFSYRLYETLCMGRIPVFVDTDCVLPLEFEIDWRVHCVWVDEGELDRIADRVLDFHESLDDSELAERQRLNRRLWEAHLSPEGFFASLRRHFPSA